MAFSALILALIGAKLVADGDSVAGAALVAFALFIPIAAVVPRVFSSRVRPHSWLPARAAQPAALALFALLVGIAEIIGIGFRQDVGRGLLALVGAAGFAIAAAMLRRKYATPAMPDSPKSGQPSLRNLDDLLPTRASSPSPADARSRPHSQ